MKNFKTVTAYIASAPKETQAKLKGLRAAIKSVAPKALEKMSYGMPYYGYHGRLVYFAGWKSHIAIYAMPDNIVLYKKEVKKYQTGKATLKFSLEQKLPIELIKKLVRLQMKRNEALKSGRPRAKRVK